MNKCFVTRLPSVVQKGNLNKLGCLTLKIENATKGSVTKYAHYTYNAEPGSTMKLTGAHFQSKTGANTGSVMTKGQADKFESIVVDNETVTFELYSKYDFMALLQDGYDEKEFGANAKYAPIKTKDIKYCEKITKLGIFPLIGDLGDLSRMVNFEGITLGYGSVTHALSGDLSTLPPKCFGLNSHRDNEGVITYTKGARHGSQYRAIALRNFEHSFADVQSFENYLVASATNAFDSTIKRGHLSQFFFISASKPTQKMKEAAWYLKNKMYKDVGDHTRTAGTYFNVYGIDFSDITSDPGWPE